MSCAVCAFRCTQYATPSRTFYFNSINNSVSVDNLSQLSEHEKWTEWIIYDESVFNNNAIWTSVCRTIRENTKLQCIEYEPSKKTSKAAHYLGMLFNREAGQNTFDLPLNSVSFNNISFDKLFVEKVTRCMLIAQLPAKIKMTNAKLDDGCVQQLVSAMNDGLHVSHLNLAHNSITDVGLGELLQANNLQYIVELSLSSNKIKSLHAIATSLGRGDLCVEDLQIYPRTPFPNESIIVMLDASISNSSRLKCLNIGKNLDIHLLVRKMENLTPSSFSAFCESNHTFQELKHHNTLLKYKSPRLKEALNTNMRKDLSDNQKCRRKLRYIYLTEDFDITPFIDMDTVYMPNVLELVTMSEERCEERAGRLDKGTYVSARNGNLGSIYRLIRYCCVPELFSFASATLPSLVAKNAKLEAKVARLELELEQLRLSSNKRRKM